VDFFVGEVADAFPGDFPVDKRVFVRVVGVPETRLIVLGDGDTPEREICLLTVSLLCLSIDGDFAVIVLPILSRDLDVLEDGAVRGLVAPVVVPLTLVDSCFNGEMDVLADAGLGFAATADCDVFVVVADDVLTSVVFAIAPLEVLAVALAGLAARLVLPVDFASPLVVDFFSAVAPTLDFDEAVVAAVVVVFGFVVLTVRREEDAFVVVVDLEVTVAAVVVVFAAVILLVLETLVVPSSCLGRAAGDFFAAADCAVVARMVVLTTFEGEVGDFVAVFVVGAAFVVVVVVLFTVRRFAVVEDVAFDFIEHAATAVTAVTVAAVAAAPAICFFNDSSALATSSGGALPTSSDGAFATSSDGAFATSSDGAFAMFSSGASATSSSGVSAICCGSVSFSTRIFSEVTSGATISMIFSSICSCLIGNVASIIDPPELPVFPSGSTIVCSYDTLSNGFSDLIVLSGLVLS